MRRVGAVADVGTRVVRADRWRLGWGWGRLWGWWGGGGVLGFFFFNDTATTEIYTLSLHDALPISGNPAGQEVAFYQRVLGMLLRRLSRYTVCCTPSAPLSGSLARRCSLSADVDLHCQLRCRRNQLGDRKSTRLNSSHLVISYAVFCLKKKKQNKKKNHIADRKSMQQQGTIAYTNVR